MKERGIIFSGEMVQALLAGTKTQTRRIMKPQPNAEHKKVAECYSLTLGRKCHESQGYAMFQDEDEIGYEIRCPYGVAGDRLWVREKWKPWGWREDDRIVVQFADGTTFRDISTMDSDGYEDWYPRIAEQATIECQKAGCAKDEEGCFTWPEGTEAPTKSRPPIHMPRWASRITLEITGVRVERLQEITGKDAEAEGMRGYYDESDGRLPRDEYAVLWDSLHGAGSWALNPWVWVLEFRKL